MGGAGLVRAHVGPDLQHFDGPCSNLEARPKTAPQVLVAPVDVGRPLGEAKNYIIAINVRCQASNGAFSQQDPTEKLCAGHGLNRARQRRVEGSQETA